MTLLFVVCGAVAFALCGAALWLSFRIGRFFYVLGSIE